MDIEIWSDVMCPFCYIGKRRFESALAQFPGRGDVHVTWKSFQLAPGMVTDPSTNIHQYLAAHKGISLEEARELNDYVTGMAAEVGLEYNFDKSVVANSFHAHRFLHFAKKEGKQEEAEEALFHAYFTDGLNIDDFTVLIQLGISIGLDAGELKPALENGLYAEDVRRDLYEARQVGVKGVPFFLFDEKYAIQGAQDGSVFQETLEKAHSGWLKETAGTNREVTPGQSCAPGEPCQ
ncbi:MAG: DsbA family oxidoreductase [Bacteroidota bacterium]